MMGGEQVKRWCILRTKGGHTLSLAKTLAEDGYEAWTPSQVPDGPTCRDDDARCPMLPTYVFADAGRLEDLFALSANPGRKHAGFSVFHNYRGVPLVADRDLGGLREEEDRVERRWKDAVRRRRSRNKGEAFEVGETVRVPADAYPSFAGMDGMVEESDARHTYISLGGFLRLKISTFILRGNGVGANDSPVVGAAA